MNPLDVTHGVAPASALRMAALLTLVGLLPAIVLTSTCFARFAIVFSFLKSGLGGSGGPPSQVLAGLALFMTMFVMAPVGLTIDESALEPYLAGKMNEKEALEAATPPLRTFLLKRTRQADLALFYDVADLPRPTSADDVPLRIAIPAFTVSELRTSFQMGFLLLLPFLVIDLVVATVLSSMGMVMLPPPVISLPVKLLVFISVDGWHLIVRSLLEGAMS